MISKPRPKPRWLESWGTINELPSPIYLIHEPEFFSNLRLMADESYQLEIEERWPKITGEICPAIILWGQSFALAMVRVGNKFRYYYIGCRHSFTELVKDGKFYAIYRCKYCGVEKTFPKGD